MNIKMILLIYVTSLAAQTQKPPRFITCTTMTKAFGEHVRFTTQEHLQLLLNDREVRNGMRFPYMAWESASRLIDWFGGDKPVSLAYVKSHMPRAMLLELRFPVNPNPHIVQADVDRLLKAEREYHESTKLVDKQQAYLKELMSKYGIGPLAMLDEDMGGAKPNAGCEKWE